MHWTLHPLDSGYGTKLHWTLLYNSVFCTQHSAKCTVHASNTQSAHWRVTKRREALIQHVRTQGLAEQVPTARIAGRWKISHLARNNTDSMDYHEHNFHQRKNICFCIHSKTRHHCPLSQSKYLDFRVDTPSAQKHKTDNGSIVDHRGPEKSGVEMLIKTWLWSLCSSSSFYFPQDSTQPNIPLPPCPGATVKQIKQGAQRNPGGSKKTLIAMRGGVLFDNKLNIFTVRLRTNFLHFILSYQH